MSLNPDRQLRLQLFVEWVAQHITGDEKGQAQIFLDRLFQAFGRPGALEVGGTPEFRIKPGAEDLGGTCFADYVWKPLVLIEMKKRGVDLARHRQQAFNYWMRLVPNRPQYTVLCNFDEIWIYDFNIDLDEPLDTIKLADLPQRYDPLAFLFATQERPVFQNNRVEVTRAAADRLASVFFHMTHVRKVERALAQRFILQMMVALFAEDIDLLPKNFVTLLLADITTPDESYDLLGSLFDAMNQPKGTPAGRFKGIQYFNGGLFRDPARIALDQDGIELAHLRQAAKENWSKVSPDIFGTLFQHSMDAGERHAFGAHYTAPIDIMKIVKPTIVEPWMEMIEAAQTPQALIDLLERLAVCQVLDPACGSGNFLYIAYREMKRLEARIRDRLKTEFPKFPAQHYHVTTRQFHGLDVLPFAIELAKVTMMLARKLAIDELHIADEPPLPLDNLDGNFHCMDALITFPKEPQEITFVHSRKIIIVHKPTIAEWPRADVIIGNPPFLGAKRLKPERGPDYVNVLRTLYPEVPGMADYCVYWFWRAQEHLPACTETRPECGRAGLVGTQNIRNNQSRVGGLDHIVKNGVIVEAVENQPWSGEANVHVSIANWVKLAGDKVNLGKVLVPERKRLWFRVDPKLALFAKTKAKSFVTTTGKRGQVITSKSYELDFRHTPHINSALSNLTDTSAALVLTCNTIPQKVFQGVTPGDAAFLLSPAEYSAMLAKDRKARAVIHPYLVGREVLSGDGTPARHLIDFEKRSLVEAQQFRSPYVRIEKRVLPKRVSNSEKGKDAKGNMRTHHKAFLERWWKLAWDRADMIAEIAKLHGRYLVCSRVTKRPIFIFIDSRIRPGDALQTFVFDDDYSFAILQSNVHWLWFITKCSKLKSDFRYTPESVFDTLAWPQAPSKKQIDAVATAGNQIRRIRAEDLTITKGGLRTLYRNLEIPGKNRLKDAHAQLDAAVLDTYGFSKKDDLLAQLLALNLEVAARIEAKKSVTAPGVPPSYGDPAELISADCIQP